MAVPQPTAVGRLTGYSAAPFYRELATRQKIALIENALPAVLSDAKLKLDELHPTAEGHAELAARAADELTAIGLLRGR